MSPRCKLRAAKWFGLTFSHVSRPYCDLDLCFPIETVQSQVRTHPLMVVIWGNPGLWGTIKGGEQCTKLYYIVSYYILYYIILYCIILYTYYVSYILTCIHILYTSHIMQCRIPYFILYYVLFYIIDIILDAARAEDVALRRSTSEGVWAFAKSHK